MWLLRGKSKPFGCRWRNRKDVINDVLNRHAGEIFQILFEGRSATRFLRPQNAANLFKLIESLLNCFSVRVWKKFSDVTGDCPMSTDFSWGLFLSKVCRNFHFACLSRLESSREISAHQRRQIGKTVQCSFASRAYMRHSACSI